MRSSTSSFTVRDSRLLEALLGYLHDVVAPTIGEKVAQPSNAVSRVVTMPVATLITVTFASRMPALLVSANNLIKKRF